MNPMTLAGKIQWAEVIIYGGYFTMFFCGIALTILAQYELDGWLKFGAQWLGVFASAFVFSMFLNPYQMVYTMLGPRIIRRERD